MENSGVQIITQTSLKKETLFDRCRYRYTVYAMMAGVFCGLGMILAFTSSAGLNQYEATKGFANIVFGISFALAFTLIVFSGSELFTGNVLVMSMGSMNKAVKLKKAIIMLVWCYIANFIGATLIALLIGATGLLNNEIVGAYLVSKAEIKMQLTFIEAFTRGILCNMLVCFATWSAAKIKSEAAKMIILVWCVYGFCTSGFEHSIANMALFVMAKVSSFTTEVITVSGYFNNMIPVTLGNIVGGVCIVAAAYYFVGSLQEEESCR